MEIFKHSKQHLIVGSICIVILVLLIYGKTIHYEFAWDDTIVLTQNTVTTKGISNFKEIWTTKQFILERPTYRPMTQSYFAIIWSLFENDPKAFHIGNIILYIICCVSMFITLSKFFPKNPAHLNLLTVFVFSLLPIHTEVVSNIKSADELLSAIFIIWSFYFAKKKGILSSFLVFLFVILSLLSKISSITVLPILFGYLVFNNQGLIRFLSDPNEYTIKSFELLAFLFMSISLYFQEGYLQIVAQVLFILYFIRIQFNSLFFTTIQLTLLFIGYYYFNLPIEVIGVISLYFVSKILSEKKAININIGLVVVLFFITTLFYEKGVFQQLFLFVTFGLGVFYFFVKQKKILYILSLLFIISTISKLYLDTIDIQFFLRILMFALFVLSIVIFLAKRNMFILSTILFLIFSLHIKINFQQYLFPEVNEESEELVKQVNDKKILKNYPYNNILIASKSTSQKLATISEIQLLYLQKVLLPTQLVHNYGVWQINLSSWSSLKVYLSLFIHILLILFVFLSYKNKLYLASFGILWYLLSISIYSNIIRLMPDTLAERFLFLPSIGFSIAFVGCIYLLTKKFIINERKSIIFTLIFFIPLLLFYGYKSQLRVSDWRNNYTLSANTLPYAQNNAAINAQYALELNNLMKYNIIEESDSAKQLVVKHYKKAIAIYPDFYGPIADLSNYYIEQAQPDSAFPYLVKAAEIMPDQWVHHYYLGLIYYERHQYTNAISSFNALINDETLQSRALEFPELLEAYEFSARCLHNTGKDNEAYAILEEGISIFQQKSTYVLLANLYRVTGKTDLAIATFKKLLSLNPNDQELINTIQYLEEGKIY